MSYSISFVDNVLYGTEDVNGIVGDLVGAGIAPFISRDSYTPEDLNSLTAAVVSAGVELGGCKVTRYTDTGNTYTIAPGIIYFGNGVRMIFAGDTRTNLPANTACTLYARYNTSTNTASLTYSTSTVTKSAYNIPLALIDSAGDVTDIRDFAQSKAATFGGNAIYSIPESKVTLYSSYSDAPDYSDGGKIVGEIDLSDVNMNRFNYFFYYYYPNGFTTYPPTDEPIEHRLWDYKNYEKQNMSESLESGNSDTDGFGSFIIRNFNKFIFVSNPSTNAASEFSTLYEELNRQKQYLKLI